MVSPDFNTFLQEAHRRSGLSLREVSQECDVDYSYVSRILSGQRVPARDVLISLAAYAWHLDRTETDDLLIAVGYQPLGRLARREG